MPIRDHPGNARAIAAQVGISPFNMQAIAKDVADEFMMTASSFDRLSDNDIDKGVRPLLP